MNVVFEINKGTLKWLWPPLPPPVPLPPPLLPPAPVAAAREHHRLMWCKYHQKSIPMILDTDTICSDVSYMFFSSLSVDSELRAYSHLRWPLPPQHLEPWCGPNSPKP